MILSDNTIKEIKAKSGLAMEQTKDFDALAIDIYNSTKRRIGNTTLKRLFGRIADDRATSQFTLNTIALYLGYQSWEEYLSRYMNSEMDYADDAIYINRLQLNQRLRVSYLDRIVEFMVIEFEDKRFLKVLSAEHSSLQEGDLLLIHRLRIGETIEAEVLYRSEHKGNYRTRGKVAKITLLPN